MSDIAAGIIGLAGVVLVIGMMGSSSKIAPEATAKTQAFVSEKMKALRELKDPPPEDNTVAAKDGEVVGDGEVDGEVVGDGKVDGEVDGEVNDDGEIEENDKAKQDDEYTYDELLEDASKPKKTNEQTKFDGDFEDDSDDDAPLNAETPLKNSFKSQEQPAPLVGYDKNEPRPVPGANPSTVLPKLKVNDAAPPGTIDPVTMLPQIDNAPKDIAAEGPKPGPTVDDKTEAPKPAEADASAPGTLDPITMLPQIDNAPKPAEIAADDKTEAPKPTEAAADDKPEAPKAVEAADDNTETPKPAEAAPGTIDPIMTLPQINNAPKPEESLLKVEGKRDLSALEGGADDEDREQEILEQKLMEERAIHDQYALWLKLAEEEAFKDQNWTNDS